MNLKLMEETVETKPLNPSDILIIDYSNKKLLVMQAIEIEDIAHITETDCSVIQACLDDHRNSTEIYVINGYTFMYMQDYLLDRFITDDIAKSPSIKSSQLLYKVYGYENYNRYYGTEILDLTTGEITHYYHYRLALNALDLTLYDILKIPLYAYRAIDDYEHYIFPMVKDNIIRLTRHVIPWEEYVYLALGDFEALEELKK